MDGCSCSCIQLLIHEEKKKFILHFTFSNNVTYKSPSHSHSHSHALERCKETVQYNLIAVMFVTLMQIREDLLISIFQCRILP